MGACYCCSCLSRAARTGTHISPSVPTSHTSHLPPSAESVPSHAVGSPASVGRWQLGFRLQVGLTASLSEIWEEAPGLPEARGLVLQKGTCCSWEAWVEQRKEDASWGSSPLSFCPTAWGLFQECRQQNKQADPPSFRPPSPNLARCRTQKP